MSKTNKASILTSAAMGLAFIVIGTMEIAAVMISTRIELMLYLSSGGNILLALVTLFTGAVLLSATWKLCRGADGEPYLLVGCMLALFVGIVTSLTFAASAVEAYLFDGEEFTVRMLMDTFTPAILMTIPALALLFHALKVFNSNAGRPTS